VTDDNETLGLIGDAARSFVRQWGGPARVRGRLDQSLAFDREEWNAVVEQGWLGLMVPEEKGGLGLSASALTVLLEQLGDGLVMSPVLPGIATAVLLARLDTAPADALLSDLMSGKSLILAALPGDIEAPALLPDAAGPSQRGWLHDGHGADAILLWDEETEQVGFVHRDRQEQAMFRAAIDGGSVGMVTSRGFEVRDLVASGPAALQAMADARDIIGIGSAAMLLGCARRALDISLAYLKTRQQFGVQIGSFQALQHRAASLHVALVSSQSFLVETSACVDGPNRAAACAAVRSRSADCALQIVKEAVQFHGAIGFADEHDVGLYFRRVVALASWHGNAAQWRQDYFSHTASAFAQTYV
jgi:alkylation response protein AidB-like acyl-CoA dehydrogenase